MIREERGRASADWPGLILEVTEDQVINDLKIANEVANELRTLQLQRSPSTISAPAIPRWRGCGSCRSAS